MNIPGHKNLRMTIRYSHLFPEHLREAVQNLDKSLTLKEGAVKRYYINQSPDFKSRTTPTNLQSEVTLGVNDYGKEMCKIK